MSEITVWVLLWVGSSYGGFVSKVDEFPSQAECVQFARDVQGRRDRGAGGIYIPGSPLCIPRKASQRAAQNKGE